MLNSREKRLLKKKNSREKKLRRNELNYIVLFGTFGDRIYNITSIIYFYIGGGAGAEKHLSLHLVLAQLFSMNTFTVPRNSNNDSRFK